MLEGELTVFFDDEDGKRASTVEIRCRILPRGNTHGFINEYEDVLMQTMIGTGGWACRVYRRQYL